MIDSISVKNYKAFQEASLRLKPITVLLGANSVGKSSILQLFLLLKQTATFGSQTDKCPFKMYGPFVNMGATENLFHNKNVKSVLEISIALKNSDLQKKFTNLFGEFTRSISTIPYMFPIKGMLEIRLSEKQMPKDRIEFRQHTKDIFDVLEKERMEDYRSTLGYLFSTNTCIAASDIQALSYYSILSTYDFLNAIKISRKESAVFTVTFSFFQKSGRLYIGGFKLLYKDKVVFYIDSQNDFFVYSDYCDFTTEDIQIIERRFNRSTFLFGCIGEKKGSEEQETTLSNYLIHIASLTLNTLKGDFHPNVIQHVKPLRANPQRYYVIDDEKLTPYASALDGDRVIEILRDNEGILNLVNSWLKKYDLSIGIEQSEDDVIHHIKIVQNGVALDITDVGFGISQLLPILVQAYVTPKKGVTIIEQPEIHLHPQMQADVADLFRLTSNSEKPFIIETHSEYLLRRIRRRVAIGEMSSDDVAIYLFKGKTKDRDYTEVEFLDMTSTGLFEWPSDFYGGELNKDIVDFIAAQS